MHNDSLILPIITLQMDILRKNYDNVSILPKLIFSAFVDGEPVPKGAYSELDIPQQQYFTINAVEMGHLKSKYDIIELILFYCKCKVDTLFNLQSRLIRLV